MNLKKYLNPADFIELWKSLYRNRQIILEMARRDFRSQSMGSFLGIFWAFVQPLVFILALWFVFAVGFRQGRGSEPVPFVLWLMNGMFIWFFFAGCISSSPGVIEQNAHLVKRIRFQVSILPIVKILSALMIHAIFVMFLFVLFAAYGSWPNLYWLQIFYYMFATIVLALGMSWITSSLNVFVKDISSIVQILVRIGFWFTPVFWKVDKVPQSYQVLIKLNPAVYLVQGYRDSLIYEIPFWQHPLLTIYFWTVTLVIFAAGMIIFRRLRPHFADVL